MEKTGIAMLSWCRGGLFRTCTRGEMLEEDGTLSDQAGSG
jgi:hypothetical protein